MTDCLEITEDEDALHRDPYAVAKAVLKVQISLKRLLKISKLSIQSIFEKRIIKLSKVK